MLHNPYSSHYHTISHPPTPFKTEIPNGLVPGKQIFVSGIVHPNADRFAIDFHTANGIAFHINPRFSQNSLVRNSDLGGWGPEERGGSLPISRGQRFECIVLVEHDRYLVAFNGQHSFEYRHRVPYQQVVALNIYGDLQLEKVVFSGGARSGAFEQFNISVPGSVAIPGGAQPGRLIQIHGHVPPHSNRFSINLQNGPSDLPNEIALHFNPRFDDPYTGTAVVRTNRQHGGWGSEERDGASPFHKGQNFEVLILVEPTEFKVAVNGAHFASFHHRNGLHDANHVGFQGDVAISAVRIY